MNARGIKFFKLNEFLGIIVKLRDLSIFSYHSWFEFTPFKRKENPI